jgi:two-component system, OmpR family, response regulator PrrA
MAEVLLVDDSDDIRETLALSLSEAGHAVRAEATGSGALGAATECVPDVIVLDLGLPDFDGADVLRMLRTVTSTPSSSPPRVLTRPRSYAYSTKGRTTMS